MWHRSREPIYHLSSLLKQGARAEAERYDDRRAFEQAAYEQKVKAANISVYILSTLVGFKNPELGHQLQVVGDSTVQVADALQQFAKADALGSVILTSDILGAVMNVVSLFGDSGPSPDAQILAAIAQLQQMVQQLRLEMHERFDRVDAALNEIYSTMNERFNRIDIVLGILRGGVEEIQQTLYDLESDLYRIERKGFNFLDAGFRRDLNETINGYLGYRETFFLVTPTRRVACAEVSAGSPEPASTFSRSYPQQEIESAPCGTAVPLRHLRLPHASSSAVRA